MSRARLEALWQDYARRYDDLSERLDGESLSRVDKVNLSTQQKEDSYLMSNMVEALLTQLPPEKQKRLNAQMGLENRVEYRTLDIAPLLTASETGLTPETLTELAESLENRLPPRLDFTPRRVYEEAITQRKQEISASELSEREKAEYLAALDHANEIFLFDTDDSTSARSAYAEKIASALDNQTMDTVYASLSQPEYADYAPMFSTSVSPITGEVNLVSDYTKRGVDPALLQRVRQDKIVVSEQLKEQLRTVWKAIDDEGLGAKAEIEDPFDSSKSRCWDRFNEVAQNASDILETGSLEEIKKLNADREESLDALRSVYAVAKEQFVGDDNSGYPSNQSRMRVRATPPEFKQSIRISTNVEIVSMMQDTLRRNHVELEDFLEDPIGTLRNAAEEFTAKYSPEGRTKGMSLGQALAHLQANVEATAFESPFAASAFRTISALLDIEPNEEVRRQNLVVGTFAAYDLTTQFQQASVANNYRSDFRRSIANIFVVNDEDRNLNTICNDGTKIDFQTMELAPPFDREEYLLTHEIDPKKIYERICDTVSQFVAANGTSQGLADVVETARDTVELLVASKAINPKSADAKALVQLYDNPLGVLKKETAARGVEMVGVPLARRKLMKDFIQDHAKQAKADAAAMKVYRKAEKATNKQLTKLQKEWEKSSARLKKSPQDPKAIADFEKKTNDLADARNEQIKRLEADRKAGKITQTYLRARTDDILKGNHDIERNMLVEGLSDKKSFMAEQAKKGVSKKEAEAAFKRAQAKEAMIASSVTRDRVQRRTPPQFDRRTVNAMKDRTDGMRKRVHIDVTSKQAQVSREPIRSDAQKVQEKPDREPEV